MPPPPRSPSPGRFFPPRDAWGRPSSRGRIAQVFERPRQATCLWGKIEFVRRYDSYADGTGEAPVDRALGLRPNGRLTRGVRRKAACAGALGNQSYARAAFHLKELAGLRLSATELKRETTEAGLEAFARQAAVDAARSRPEEPGQPSPAARTPETVVIAPDGFMALGHGGRRGRKPAREPAAAEGPPVQETKAPPGESSIERAEPETPEPEAPADAPAPGLEAPPAPEAPIATPPSADAPDSPEETDEDAPDDGPPTGRGDGKTRGMEVKVGVVFALDARLRAGDDRPFLEERRVVQSVEGVEHFGLRLLALARWWGLRHARRVVVLGDGAKWIWVWALTFLGETAIQIVDYWHARDHLVTLAGLLWGPHTPEAQEFGREQGEALRRGRVADVIAALEGLKTTRRGERRRAIAREIGYFRENQARMRYPDFEAAGLPIGSGCIEATGKSLVKSRLSGSGMRWEKEGVRAVMALRELEANDDWDAFWNETLPMTA